MEDAFNNLHTGMPLIKEGEEGELLGLGFNQTFPEGFSVKKVRFWDPSGTEILPSPMILHHFKAILGNNS